MNDHEKEGKKYRIRTKMLLGFLTVVLLMTVVLCLIMRQQSIIEDSFLLLEELNTIHSLLLECRRQEKNFILRLNDSSQTLYDENFNSLLSTTIRLHHDESDPGIKGTLALLAEEEKEYGRTFENLKTYLLKNADSEKFDRLSNRTVKEARDCHSLVDEIERSAQTKLNAAQTIRDRISLTSIIAALVLSILIAVLLTQNITGPLEYLRDLAEKVQSGDIQDIDIEFSDLEVKRFNTKETFALAMALQGMITKLRHLVSSERGLMTDYHMTIQVLVNSALGTSGRAVIERARIEAGFASFHEITPSNVDRFLVQLEKQIADLLPEERSRALIKAIRELKSQHLNIF